MTLRRNDFVLIGSCALAIVTSFWPQAVHAQVKLEYKFPEGQKLTFKATSRVRQVVTLMNNMQLESIKKEVREWSRSVGEHRVNSIVPIEEKIKFLRVDYALPGGIKLNLDSTSSDTKIETSQLAFLGDLFKLESSIVYVVLLDKDFKVKGIEGTEKLLEQAGKLREPMVREEFQSEINADRLRIRFEQSLRKLPDVPVRTGESWERTELLDINGKTFTVRKKYEYRGNEKKGERVLEKLSHKVLEVKFDQDPKGTLPLKVVKNNLKIESSEGTILFDREQGYVVSAIERMRFKGEISFSGAGVEQSGELSLSFDCDTQLVPAAK